MGAFAYVLLLIIVALEVPLALNLARRIDAEVKNEAAAQAFVVASGASGLMNNPKQLAALARRAGRDLGGRVIIVDRHGRLRADSTNPSPRPVVYASPSRPELRTALSGQRAQGERHSATLGVDLLYTAVPMTNNSVKVGAVRVTQSLDAVHARGCSRAPSPNRCGALPRRRAAWKRETSRRARSSRARASSAKWPRRSTT